MSFDPISTRTSPIVINGLGNTPDGNRHRKIEATYDGVTRIKSRLDRMNSEEEQGYGLQEFERLMDNAADLLVELVGLETEGRAYFHDPGDSKILTALADIRRSNSSGGGTV